MKIKVQKLHPDAVVPTYITPGAACFDLYALDGGWVGAVNAENAEQKTVSKGAAVFRTGLAFEVPAGHVMLIFSRSGHGFNHDVRLSNCVGVIDSDYRGEVKVKLRSEEKPFAVHSGDRIAQAMILPVPAVEIELAETLSSTQRGTGGFGSTGA